MVDRDEATAYEYDRHISPVDMHPRASGDGDSPGDLSGPLDNLAVAWVAVIKALA